MLTLPPLGRWIDHFPPRHHHQLHHHLSVLLTSTTSVYNSLLPLHHSHSPYTDPVFIPLILRHPFNSARSHHHPSLPDLATPDSLSHTNLFTTMAPTKTATKTSATKPKSAHPSFQDMVKVSFCFLFLRRRSKIAIVFFFVLVEKDVFGFRVFFCRSIWDGRLMMAIDEEGWEEVVGSWNRLGHYLAPHRKVHHHQKEVKMGTPSFFLRPLPAGYQLQHPLSPLLSHQYSSFFVLHMLHSLLHHIPLPSFRHRHPHRSHRHHYLRFPRKQSLTNFPRASFLEARCDGF